MDSLIETLGMGPHAPYVWGSYVITFVVLAVNVLLPLRRARQLRAELRAEARTRKAAP